MNNDLSLTSEIILNKVFDASDHGYNALEVDEFLDMVLEDYRHLEKCRLVPSEKYNELITQVEELKKKCDNQEIEINKYKSRLKGIKDSDYVSRENLDLLARIHILEKFLFENGYDPNSIK